MIEYQFVQGEYFATGEGITRMVLITRAYPKAADYKTQPSFETDSDGKLVYVPGILNKDKADIAMDEFIEIFGSWYGVCGEVVTQEVFLAKNQKYIPQVVFNVLKDNENDGPANFKWHSMFHVNYS